MKTLRLWFGGCVLVLVCGQALAATTSANPYATQAEAATNPGMYIPGEAAPDRLLAKQMHIRSTWAYPDRIEDQGKTICTSITFKGYGLNSIPEGEEMTWTGRSTGFGCTYWAIGPKLGAPAAGRGGTFTDKVDSWANFEDVSPSIALEVNGAGIADDVVLLGPNGGTLTVLVMGSIGLNVSVTANPLGKVGGLPTTAINIGANSSNAITLEGLAESENVVITASAVNGGTTITASITVKVFPFRATITPADNFTGRSRDKLGIGETGTLGVEGATLNSLKPLTWSIVGGTSLQISQPNPPDGTGTFAATDAPGNIRLRLTDNTGRAVTYDVSVIEPTGLSMERLQGSGIFHTQNQIGAGFVGVPKLLPGDVSFANVLIKETSGGRRLGGIFIGVTGLNGVMHSPNYIDVSGGADGNRVGGQSGKDYVTWLTAYTTQIMQSYTGWIEDDIVWNIKVGQGGQARQWRIILQREDVNAAGDCTIIKAGYSETAKYGDATVPLPLP